MASPEEAGTNTVELDSVIAEGYFPQVEIKTGPIRRVGEALTRLLHLAGEDPDIVVHPAQFQSVPEVEDPAVKTGDITRETVAIGLGVWKGMPKPPAKERVAALAKAANSSELPAPWRDFANEQRKSLRRKLL